MKGSAKSVKGSARAANYSKRIFLKWGRASENGKVGKAAFQRAQKFMYSNKIEKNANGKKKVR